MCGADVCAQVWGAVPIGVCEGTCGGQVLILDVFLNPFSVLLVFTQCFSLNLELAALARLVTSKFFRRSWHPPCLSQAMFTAACDHAWLLQGAGGPN